MTYISLLRDWNSRLELVFLSLGNARSDSPVFAIEHGLDREELTVLFDLVGSEVRRGGFDLRWTRLSLPLIVVATEVGYEYRGTGSDYWPRLEERLGVTIPVSGRELLTGLFQAAHHKLGLKKPVNSAWTRAFRHIAWPIANAVAPREIQRPLAAALRQVVRLAPANRLDSDFAEDLRYVARGSASTRFREWAEDQGVARTLIYHLLDLPDHESRLSAVTVARLIGDLEKDAEAKGAIRGAIVIHRQRRRTARMESLPHGTSKFVLHPDSVDGFSLFLRFPTLQPPFRNFVEAALATFTQGVTFWGCVGPIPADLVLSGLDVAIESDAFSEVLVEGHAFHGNEGVDEVDPLAELAPNQALPLIFRNSPSGTALSQIDESRILPDDRVVILTDRASPPAEGIAVKAPVCGLNSIELDFRYEAARIFAERLGIHVSGKPVAEFVGGILLSEDWQGPIYAAGYPLLLKPVGMGPASVSVTVSKEDSVEVEPGEAVILDLEPGRHTIRMVAGSLASDAFITIFDAEPLQAGFDVLSEPAGPTIDDLLAGRLVMKVASPRTIANVPATMSLLVDGYLLAESSYLLSELPCAIHGKHTLVAGLIGKLAKQKLPRERRFQLRLKLGRYWSKAVDIGWSPRSCEWIDNDGIWRAFGSDFAFPLLPIPLEGPLSHGDAREDFPVGETFTLLIPVADGIEQTGDGRIIGPSKLELAKVRCDVPFTLPRYVKANKDGPGLSQLLDRYFGWSVAEADTSIAAAAGRIAVSEIETTLVRMLCGERWSHEEVRTELLPGSRFRGLARVAWNTGLAVGEDLPSLQPEQRPRLINLLAREIECRWNPAWDRYNEIVPDEFAEQMDTAVITAYEAFGAGLAGPEREPFKDVDTWREPEAWQKAAKRTQEMLAGAGLAQMILPVRRADRLLSTDYYRLASDEVVRLLDDCHTDLQSRNVPRWLSREHLQLGFWLWTAPVQVVAMQGWRPALERLIDDRATARAIRYAALRFRASRGIDVAGYSDA